MERKITIINNTSMSDLEMFKFIVSGISVYKNNDSIEKASFDVYEYDKNHQFIKQIVGRVSEKSENEFVIGIAESDSERVMVMTYPQNKLKFVNKCKVDKPKKEDYGWHEKEGYDGEPSGWLIEGGEEAYFEALNEWEQNNQ